MMIIVLVLQNLVLSLRQNLAWEHGEKFWANSMIKEKSQMHFSNISEKKVDMLQKLR